MRVMISGSGYFVLAVALGSQWGCGSSTPKAAAAVGGTGSAGNAALGGAPCCSGGAGGSSSLGGGSDISAGGSGSGGAGGSSGAGGSAGAGEPSGTTTASGIAAKLGKTSFLIGMGSDYDPGGDHSKDGAYLLGTTLDLHYGYLVGLAGKGGWADWNAGGTFVNVLTDSADKKGVVPMFTLYQMAAGGDGNLAGLSDDTYMKPYFDGVKLLFQRLAAFGKPAVVQFEPDFWAYAELQSKDDPTKQVNVTANAADCIGLSNDLIGMGHCMLKLARLYAPKALVGFHVSNWSSGDPNLTVRFMKAVGADQGDLLFTDVLDRDAGCYEAGVDCPQRDGVYWDETNVSSPNFHENLAWTKTITSGLGRPMMWWQVPFGVPSPSKGGTTGHYRDNRVHYLFSHIQEFIDAGGVGAVFGAGADKQTTPTTDGGQFKAAVTSYFAKPVALP